MSADTLLLRPGQREISKSEEQENPESDGTFEFHDSQGKLVFTVSPVGLDRMSPDKIERWQLVLPLTSVGNEVGDIAISHLSAGSEQENKYFTAVSLQDGDDIILHDKRQDKRLVVRVAINPETMKIKLTPTEKE